jgi:predicted dehydrogenase
VSFVETNPTRRDEIAQLYPAARAYVDLGAALRDGKDAAVVATPAPLHATFGGRLAEAGVDALIEKPLAVTIEDADELLQTVRDYGGLTAVAYVYRAHPALADMRAAITSGRLGAPLQVVAVCGQHFPTYRPAYRQTYYASHESGGGAVQDALTHVLNAAEWLVGPIDRVVADSGRLALDGVDVEDTVHVLARHGSVLASYSLNQHQAPNETALTVVCENGTARFEYHACRWRLMTRPDEPWQDFNFGPLQRDELFIRQANAFLDAVEGKAPPACTLEEGATTLRANIAVLASAREGKWIDV